jgi:hypothetical protein
MNSEVNVTEKMRAAGNAMAEDLVSAYIARDMGGLGGSGRTEFKSNPGDLDILVACLQDEIDTATAIYLVMERCRRAEQAREKFLEDAGIREHIIQAINNCCEPDPTKRIYA